MFPQIPGLDYCVLRRSNPCGPRPRAEKAPGVVTAFLQSVMNGEEIAIWGDGSVVRDYMYVGDAVDAMARTAESGYCGVVNIGSGKGLSVNEVIAGIEKVTGRAARRSYLAARPFDVPANVLDVSLAREKLGWSPTTTFEAGLERTAAFLASKT
jgi:UDP-glucose 4-epimerase